MAPNLPDGCLRAFYAFNHFSKNPLHLLSTSKASKEKNKTYAENTFNIFDQQNASAAGLLGQLKLCDKNGYSRPFVSGFVHCK